MTDETDAANAGWFSQLEPGEPEAAGSAIIEGTAERPDEWPRLAVETGYADSTDDYYDRLHEATLQATRREVRARERADDSQLMHAIRAMDDCQRTANELAERVAEWGGTLDPEAGTGIEYARALVEADGERDVDEPALDSLAARVVSLDDEAARLRTYVEQSMPTVAPNLSALAGPILGARLISLAGGLESLAKKPSGTVQVLGAEDALFAHLRGHAPSPKHGIIYTHDGVRGTPPENRGSAARALAGKLSIAARVDHYSGEYRPELEDELADRLETIQARTADGAANSSNDTDGDTDE